MITLIKSVMAMVLIVPGIYRGDLWLHGQWGSTCYIPEGPLLRGQKGSTWYIPSRPVVTRAIGKYLVDTEEARGDAGRGEVPGTYRGGPW